jgi:hypothetical protein
VVRKSVSGKKLRKSWAWKIDANAIAQLEEHEIAEAFDALMPLQAGAVRLFVDADDHDITVLVGPKGSGKTFLLLARSFYQRRRSVGDGIRFFPTIDLIERIGSGVNLREIADERRDLWTLADSWRDAWSISICAIAVEVAGLRGLLSAQDRDLFATFFPEYFHTDEPGKPVSRAKHKFTFFLRQAMHGLASKHLRNALLSLHQSVMVPALSGYNGPIAFFLDAPDEAIESSGGEGGATVSSWVQMQLGLLLAIRQIRQVKSNLHVYATLRSEIYRTGGRSAQFQQARMVCLKLAYKNVQLKEIFEKNCEADQDKWYLQNQNSSITAFLGLSSTQHSCVVDQDRQAVEENAFDHLLRHTFYLPRDLMEVGHAISTNEGYDPRDFKSTVNETSYALLSYRTEQVYPAWDPLFLAVLKFFKTNVLSKRMVNQARRSFWEQAPWLDGSCPFTYLYFQGLLGYLNTIGGQRQQQFCVDATVEHTSWGALPAADWYFLHPALNQQMDRLHGQSYRKHTQVICGHLGSVAPLESLRFELDSSGHVNVEFEGQQLFRDRFTAPKGLLMVAAKACATLGEATANETALGIAYADLVREGWIAENTGVWHCVERYLSGASDQAKQVNAQLRNHGVPTALRRMGDRIKFLACEPSQIDFSNTTTSSSVQ